MEWAFLDRWRRFLRLVAVAAGDRDAATMRVRDAFSDAGAWVTDVHFFSGVQTVFNFEVAADRLAGLLSALERAGLALDTASREAYGRATAVTTGDVEGTLAVFFKDGDPTLTHEVPAVPG